KIYKETTKITKNIAYYVPRNVDPQQLADFMGRGNVCELQKVFVNSKFVAAVGYFGNLMFDLDNQELKNLLQQATLALQM
ncbi:19097_t:CDS:2, partial [Entrophospora sp. SA101]